MSACCGSGSQLETTKSAHLIVRTCCCSDGIVVKGEYGVTYAIMRRGYLIDTLMSKYKQARGSSACDMEGC